MTRSKLYTALALGSAMAFTWLVWHVQGGRMGELEEQLRTLSKETETNARQTEHALMSARQKATPIVVAPAAEDGAESVEEAEESIEVSQREESEKLTGYEDEAAQDVPTAEDQAAYVDAVFTEEPLDPLWGRETEALLNGQLEGRLGPAQLESLECHQTLCRAQLSHDSQLNYSEFVDRLVADANDLWLGPIFALKDGEDENGVVHNTIYFAKAGSEMPAL